MVGALHPFPPPGPTSPYAMTWAGHCTHAYSLYANRLHVQTDICPEHQKNRPCNHQCQKIRIVLTTTQKYIHLHGTAGQARLQDSGHNTSSRRLLAVLAFLVQMFCMGRKPNWTIHAWLACGA